MSFALSALSVVRGNGHCHSMSEPVSGSDRVGCTIFKSQRNRICRRQFSRHWTRVNLGKAQHTVIGTAPKAMP